MKQFLKGKHGKLGSAILVSLLLVCYLLVTGASAQDVELKSTNAKINYGVEPLSYGDVWAFTQEVHSVTSYNLYGSQELTWYSKGGAGNKDSNTSNFASSYFEKAVISGGKLDTSASVAMSQLAYDKFNSGVQAGTVTSAALSSIEIPVVKLSGNAAGIYSVVPGKTGTFYVHAYVEGATADSVVMNYAKLDSCADTNAYASGDNFPEQVELQRIGETDWYRGEVSVDVVSWSAASVSCKPSNVTDNKNVGNSGDGTYQGLAENATSLSLDSTTYYYNVWTNAKAYYDTVLVFQIPTGTALGPISTRGNVIIENKATEMGTLVATSVFGESLAMGEELELPNMPIVLTVQPNEGKACMGFSNAAGAEVPVYVAGKDNANAIQTVTAGATYVYYHENSGSAAAKVSVQWADDGITLPEISVSGDTTAYNFLDAKIGATTFTKGTKATYTFALDIADTAFASGTYTVVGDTIDGASTITGTITADAPSFDVICKYDETVVTINIQATDGNNYAFKYTMRPVISGEAAVKNLTTGVSYVFLEDAIMEADSGQTITLLKHTSFQPTVDGIMSTRWLRDGAGYTIDSGVTLLVPFDDANTVITNNMQDYIDGGVQVGDLLAYQIYPEKTLYRQLTMPSGTKLTVASGGSLNVGSKVHPQMVGQTGPYGAIKMEADSNITVKGGATLYAWGYIFHGDNGSGTVTVERTGTVYEPLMIMDYPGSADRCLNIYGGNGYDYAGILANLGGGVAFPMRAFTFRSVEVPMTFHKGATEMGFYHLYGDSIKNIGGYVTLVGEGSGAVFQMTGNNTTLVKSYKDGKQYLQFNGDMSLHSMSLFVTNLPIFGDIYADTAKTSGVPLPGGFVIDIASGTTTLYDNYIAVEGSQFKLAEGATLNTNGKNIYVLDADDDYGTVSATDVHGVQYTLVEEDALLDINGTLIASGGFYTSDKKAAIISSEGTGQIQVTGISTNKDVPIRCVDPEKAVYIPMSAAQLKNGNDTYVSTAAGGTFKYDAAADAWRCETHTDVKHNCSVCGATNISTCTDTNPLDGNCDICGAVLCEHLTRVAIDEAKAPTCTDKGITAGEKCADCGAIITAQEEIPANGHAPVGEWLPNGDNTKHYKICNNCGEPTNEADHTGGTATCVAVKVCDVCGLDYGAVDTDNGHSWTVTYNFAADGSACTATRTCANSAEHNVTATATITPEVTQKPTCTAMGTTTYTATFDVAWAEPQTKDVVDVQTLEHNYVDGVCDECGDECEHDYIDDGYGLKFGVCGTCGQIQVALTAMEVSFDAEVLLWTYFYIPDEVLNNDNMYVEVTKLGGAYGDEVKQISMKAIRESGPTEWGDYRIEQGIPSPEMGCDVVVRFVDESGSAADIMDYVDGSVDKKVTRRAVDYAIRALEVLDDEDTKNLVKAMLVYGGYAQKFFDTHADNPVYNFLSENDLPDFDAVTASTIEQELTITGNENMGISFSAQEAHFDSAIYHRVFFKLDEGKSIEDFKFELTWIDFEQNLHTTDVTDQVGYDSLYNEYYVDATGIPSPYLDFMYTFTVTDVETNETYVVKTGVMAWVKAVLQKSNWQEQIDLAKAVYYYNQAANVKFGK